MRLAVLGEKSNRNQVADEPLAFGRRQVPEPSKLGTGEPHARHLGKLFQNGANQTIACARTCVDRLSLAGPNRGMISSLSAPGCHRHVIVPLRSRSGFAGADRAIRPALSGTAQRGPGRSPVAVRYVHQFDSAAGFPADLEGSAQRLFRGRSRESAEKSDGSGKSSAGRTTYVPSHRPSPGSSTRMWCNQSG